MRHRELDSMTPSAKAKQNEKKIWATIETERSNAKHLSIVSYWFMIILCVCEWGAHTNTQCQRLRLIALLFCFLFTTRWFHVSAQRVHTQIHTQKKQAPHGHIKSTHKEITYAKATAATNFTFFFLFFLSTKIYNLSICFFGILRSWQNFWKFGE